MGLGGSLYKLAFESNAQSTITPTRRELALLKQVTMDSISPTEKYQAALKQLESTALKTDMSAQALNEAYRQLDAEQPEAIAAQEELNNVLRHGASVLAQLRTPADDYAAALEMNEKAAKAMGWSQEQLNQANEAARQKLPEVAAAQRELNADMKRGEQVTRQNETETERLNRELAELDRLFDANAISAETLSREKKRLAASTTSARAAEDRLNAEMREGKQLTQSLETAEERRNRELARSRALLASGAISQSTYNRHLAQSRMQQIQSIPVVGNLSTRFAGMHPAAMVAVAGLAALAIEMRVVIGAAKMLSDAVKEQFKEIDELGKSARKLGISAQDLIVFSDISKELSGIEFSTVDKSLTRMTRNVSEAAESGKGKVFEALQAMNLSASELNEMSVTDKYKAIAQGISGISNEADQARYAVDLFGKQGAEMLNMLRAGSAGFEEGAAQAREYGATLSELDVVSNEKMLNTLGDVGDVITGIVQDLAVDLALPLTAIGEELIEALKPGSALGDNLRFAFEMIPPAIAIVADNLNVLIGQFQLLQTVSVRTASAVVGGLAAIDRAEAFVNPFRKVNDDLQFMAADMARQTEVMTNDALERIAAGSSGAIQNRVKELQAELAKSAAERKSAGPLIDDEDVDTTETLKNEVDKLTESLQEQIATYGMSSEAKELWKVKQAGGDTTVLEGLQKELEAKKAAEQAAESYAKTVQKLTDEIENFGKTSDEVLRDKEFASFGPEQQTVLKDLQQQLDAKMKAAEVDKELEEFAKELDKEEKKLSDERTKREEKRIEDLQNYEKELQKQIATQGMTTNEVKLWELAQEGATEQELEHVKALQAEADAVGQLTGSFVDAQRIGERETLEGLAKARQQALKDRFSKEPSLPKESEVALPEPILREETTKEIENKTQVEPITLPPFTFSSVAQTEFARLLQGAIPETIPLESDTVTLSEPVIPPFTFDPAALAEFERMMDEALYTFGNVNPFEPVTVDTSPSELETFNAPQRITNTAAPLPITQPIVGDPEDKAEMQKQTKLQESIAKNTAKPMQIIVEEVTL